jgi:hypothetical protein
MRPPAILLATALLCTAGAALADPLPNFIPTHDLTGTYLMTSPNGDGPKHLAVEYSAALRTARITPDEGGGYILYDFGAHDAKMVMPPMQRYMDMPQLAAQANLVQGAGGNPAPTDASPPSHPQIDDLGTKTIAGHDCRVVKVTDQTDGHWSKICSTPDGVILEVTTDEGDEFIAQTVSYAAVPPADLQIPPGFTAFAMPTLPNGMTMPMPMPGTPPGQ